MQLPLTLLKGSEGQAVHTAHCWVVSAVQQLLTTPEML